MRVVVWMFIVIPILLVGSTGEEPTLAAFAPTQEIMEYVGRFDFSEADRPKVWNPGAYARFSFEGARCELTLIDELKFGAYHNYVTIVVDGGEPRRVKLTNRINEILIADGLSEGTHEVLVCKDTESNIGYIQFAEVRCKKLLAQRSGKKQIIEFIGDSITCGNGNDTVAIPCGKGEWYDQHNAYLAYGPLTARTLNTDYLLSSFSGIGVYKSCCGIKYQIDDIYHQLDLQPLGKTWKNNSLKPDIVCITLGQNDGVVDKPGKFVAAYLRFLKMIRETYPSAQIVCCSSPMASNDLKAFHAKYIPAIVDQAKRKGDKKITYFLYDGQYRSGCGSHPTLSEHAAMSSELSPFLSTLLEK
jgi:lysophospholipase L1-like esterase